MKYLVLCAGLGTRLRPITDHIAKPALPVLGVPTLWYSIATINELAGHDCEIAINVSHKPDSVLSALKDAAITKRYKNKFHVSDESKKILGSSGVFDPLRSWIGKDDVLVLNGDCISFLDLRRLVSFHTKSKSKLTIHVREHKSNESYTSIEVNDESRVTGLGEKKKAGLMFSGAYVISNELIKDIPTGVSELRPTVLEPGIENQHVYAYLENTEWFDTGTPESFAETQFALPKNTKIVNELIALKSKEIQSGIWCPIDWASPGKISVRAPAVFSGSQKKWEALLGDKTAGPRFVGISPPTKEMKVFSNVIVSQEASFEL